LAAEMGCEQPTEYTPREARVEALAKAYLFIACCCWGYAIGFTLALPGSPLACSVDRGRDRSHDVGEPARSTTGGMCHGSAVFSQYAGPGADALGCASGGARHRAHRREHQRENG